MGSRYRSKAARSTHADLTASRAIGGSGIRIDYREHLAPRQHIRGFLHQYQPVIE